MEKISITRLLLGTIPALIVIFTMWKWNYSVKKSIYGMGRMFAQLLLIGYVLTWIFLRESPWPVLATLSIMLISATWISLNSTPHLRGKLLKVTFLAIFLGAGANLILMSSSILQTDPWYNPKIIVPLAGMCFSTAMNSISITTERLVSELKQHSYDKAKLKSLSAGMIPITNSLFAVGLVSLPGMMTGQIFAGTDPLIAARYQIMIMCMLFGTSGLSAIIFLILAKNSFENDGVFDNKEVLK